MLLSKKVHDDLVIAMKARDQLRTSVLRMVIADLTNARIAKGADLTDDEVLGAIKGGVKRDLGA